MSNPKKEALGKGIRALLEGIDSEVSPGRREELLETVKQVGSISSVPLTQIEINPFQPRADFDPQRLEELAESIRSLGVVQPITVRRLEEGKYQLIAGERRLRASRMAGLKEIPAYIRTANDQEMLEFALVENIQREDLNAIEVAITYKRLIEECAITKEEMAMRLGKDRSTVTNYLRLLKLPPEIQKGIKERTISMGHARALINIDDPMAQTDIYRQVVGRELSVRQTEDLVRRYREPRQPGKPTEKKLPLAYRKVQDTLASHLGTKVTLKHKATGKGEIVIHYFSDDDLDRVLDILNPS
jgi:ParB family transcriptional regulator, chromosome partitioning protein